MVLPAKDVLAHVIDVHCHPTDNEVGVEDVAGLPIRLCAMASRADDQAKVADLATKNPKRVIPGFGQISYHPWFYHTISLLDAPPPKEEHYRSLFLPPNTASHGTPQRIASFQELLPALPEPVSLKSVVDEVRANLLRFSDAVVGEVGLDRSFRHAYQPYPSPPPRKLSPFTTPIEHQIAVLEAQLDLAVELRRHVSLHSVNANQATVSLLTKMKEKHQKAWREISIDIHSCSLSLEAWRELEKANNNIFLSLSTIINGRSENHEHLIRHCRADRLLAESDYNDIKFVTSQTWEILETISRLRGWPLETFWESDPPEEQEGWGTVRRLEANFAAFLKGGHQEVPPTKNRKLRKQLESYPSDEESNEDE